MGYPTPTAANVTRGIERLGSARSPEKFTPAMIPATAGKNTAKTVQNPARWGGPSAALARLSVASCPNTSASSESTMAP